MNEEKTNKKSQLTGIILLLFILFVAISLFKYFSRAPESPVKTPLPPAEKNFKPTVTPAYPAQVLDLSNWKLTLPLLRNGNSSKPLDINQPELATYENSPWFTVTPDKKGVVFRAPVNAPTTSNSDYPRSELREMEDDGKNEIFWPSTDGVHTLFLDEAITAVPRKKPDVVAGQIHGDDDDLIVVRLEYPKLYISRGGSNLSVLDENYTLGKRFTVKFVASDGKIAVYYNNGGAPVYTLEKKVKEAYFKAGVYTQSNCETEDSAELCSADNFGEVIIYQAQVTHQ